ncbi:hypothetical protein ABVK25_011443 [Lepraria finkii]|uniref:Cytochrome P450 n=1 Tax=Lepraria finkii TaxID=1340010 RepID=A0ABR4APQ2_9LECA
MRDPSTYPDSMRFNGFRFVDEQGIGSVKRFTDTSPTYPLWGLGKRSCPGRYFAARVLKLVLAHVLLNYDIKVNDDSKGGIRCFSWRSAIIPKSGTTLLFRKLSQT